MQAGDRGLHLVGARPSASKHRFDQGRSLGDRRAVPQRAVLVGQQDDLTVGIGACSPSGVRGQRQRQQSDAFRLVWHQFDQHPASRMASSAKSRRASSSPTGAWWPAVKTAYTVANTGRSRSGSSCSSGTRYGMWALAILALARLIRLADRGLGNQKDTGDVDCGQPTDRSQRQCNLRLGRQCRVATGEQQPQPIVAIVGVVVVHRRALAQEPKCFLFLRCSSCFAPQAVEGLVASNGGQPGTRLVGNAVTSPRVGGGDDRIVQRVLRPVDVTRQTNEGGQNLATLDANDLVERIDQLCSPKSMTGRTSTLPYQAPGICAAQLMASSRSLQSSR